LIIYNAVAPDGGNALNAVFTIENIEKYPDNTVMIFDRWGIKVYETNGYNQRGNVFKGEASGNTRYGNGARVNQDTYFYVMKYRKNTTETYRERSGYLYLKRE
jgi:gliding motility-associated-like protein